MEIVGSNSTTIAIQADNKADYKKALKVVEAMKGPYVLDASCEYGFWINVVATEFKAEGHKDEMVKSFNEAKASI